MNLLFGLQTVIILFNRLEIYTMTTYSFTVELSEQELWSVEEALKFYVTPEAAKLRAERPDLVRYAGLEHIYRILGTKKLYDQPQLSTCFLRFLKQKKLS